MGKFTAAVSAQRTGTVSPEQNAALAALEKSRVSGAAAELPAGGVAQEVGGAQVQAVPQEIAPAPAYTGTEEQFAEVAASPHYRVDEQTNKVREATPEETREDYLAELNEGKRDYNVYDPETDVVQVPQLGKLKKTEGLGQMTTNIAKVTNALSGTSSSARKGIEGTGAIPKIPDHLVDALAKLGVSEGSTVTGETTASKSKFRMKQGAAGAAYLATMVALQKSMGQSQVIDEYTGAAEAGGVGALEEGQKAMKGSADNISRFALNGDIGSAFEQLVRPAPNVDPQTGAATGTGYQAPAGQELTQGELEGIGDLIMAGMEQAGLVNAGDLPDGSPALIQKIAAGDKSGRRYEYAITREGLKQLQDMGPALLEIAPGLSRPVALVPQPKAKAIGAKAVAQKDITFTPLDDVSVVTPQMEEALDAIGRTPNMINDRKLEFIKVALQDVVEKDAAMTEAAKQEIDYANRMDRIAKAQDWAASNALRLELETKKAELAPKMESPYAELFNQDQASVVKRIEDSQLAATATPTVKYKDGSWLNSNGDDKTEYYQARWEAENPGINPTEGEHQFKIELSKREDGISHLKFAKDVKKMALRKAQKTIDDATKRQGKVFYYQATVIGNSGRIMISNTELNYQSDKLSRFLVDNPKPVVFKKGGGSSAERGFEYVVARNLVDGADKYTPERLVQLFREPNFQSTINPVAIEMYEASTAPPAQRQARMAEAFKKVKEIDGIPQDWSAKDEWGFVMDALVDWGKYKSAPQDGNVSTRVKAEGDGINNGSSIQGMQFGVEDILRRAGVIYDPETGEVIPEGNMREMVFTSMLNNGELNVKSDDDRETVRAVLNTIAGSGPLIKKLVKIPLMTTIYGKPKDSHGKHIGNYVASNYQKLGLSVDEIPRVKKLLNTALQTGLQLSLTEALVHQDLVKQAAGFVFNAIEEIPLVRGANDYVWQSSGYEMRNVLTPKGKLKHETSGYTLDAQGNQVEDKKLSSVEIQEKVASALGSKKPEPVWDKKEKEYVPGQRSVGNITRNQLAVNGTHNIDATIAQETVVEFRKKGLWGHQVFDAFIGDAESFGKIMDIGNEKFVSVNNRYSLLEAELQAYEDAMGRFRQKLKNNPKDTFDIQKDMKGLHFFLQKRVPRGQFWVGGRDRVLAKLSSMGITYTEGEAGNLKLDKVPELTKAQVSAIVDYIDHNYGMDTGYLKGQKASGTVLPTRAAFKQLIRQVEDNKRRIREQYHDHMLRPRQYN